MITPTFNAVISMPDDAHESRALGSRLIRITGRETDGTIGVWEELAEPGDGPPMHVHHREEEMFFVAAGRFRFWCGEETFEGGPGTTAVLPRGVPHTWRNVGEAGGRMIVCVTPGGFEQFFLDAAGLLDQSPEAITALARRYGLEFVASDALSAAA